MSVKVHEAFSIDSFQDRLLWWDDFLGDQLKDEWGEGGTGSAAVVDAQTGGIVRITTGALNNDSFFIDWNDIRSLHIDQKATMELMGKLSHTTLLRVDLQMRFDGTNYVGFRYNTAADATWKIISINGASTVSDSGVTPDTDYHIYRIECLPTGEVHFYIDGVETANSPITTNIPDDVGDFLQPYFQMRTLENVAKSIDVDYAVIRQEI